jgi:hypothetical protein
MDLFESGVRLYVVVVVVVLCSAVTHPPTRVCHD